LRSAHANNCANSAGTCNSVPVESKLLAQADRLVGGSDAVLVIDNTAIPKKGRSTDHAGFAVVSSRELDKRSGSAGASECSG
jgi:hypothetical protein